MDQMLGSLPNGILIIECDECPRISRYTRQALIDRFGPEAMLSAVLPRLCRRSTAEAEHRPRFVGVLRG